MSVVALDTAQAFSRLSNRVERFRSASRARGASPPLSPKSRHFAHAFFELYARRPYWERYARSLALALEREPVYLFEDERLVGLIYQGHEDRPEHSSFREQFRPFSHWEHTVARSADIDPFVGVSYAPGHVGWRWDRILELGVEGLMARIRDGSRNAPDAQAKRLCRAALILWGSVLLWNDRHVAALEEKAKAAAGPERTRLRDLAALCRRVPRRPARTFHEAVQAFHVQHLALMYENPYGGNGPGRLDYFLWPYLERDLERGAITREAAKELVDELLIRLHERIQNHDGWVEANKAGGSHPDGTSSLNPLSYMLVDSIGALDQTHPSIYTRLSLDDPEDFLDLNVRYLIHGRNRAQIYNEPAILNAVTRHGVPFEDAAHYMAGGCMEISVQGAACDLNWTRVYNVAKSLELVLNGGTDLLSGQRRIAHHRSLPDYTDFEDLLTAFECEVGRYLREMARALDIASECYAAWRPCYLLSSLVDDCLERGREQQDGGARYHDYGFAIVGLTSAADSLNAIRRAVFEERFVTAGELLRALRADYEGFEPLRLRLNRIRRYGAGDPAADALANRLLGGVCRLATETPTRFGGRLKPMFFNFVWTPEESRRLGARADGLRAGERIGHGMTPQQPAMTGGITTAMNSCVSLDYAVVSGGATTMWDLAADFATPEIVKALLKRFLAGGGMIFQGNTTSVAELEDAIEHPERYPSLTVRVGGFSARFVTLNRELQQEILTRYRHRQ